MAEHEAEGLFSQPDAELAERAMRELSWAERLTISKMNPATGTENVDVYNLPHAVLHLFGTRWDRLLLDGSRAGIAYVDTARLIAWLSNVIGDRALADAVAECLAEDVSYEEKIEAIQPLFKERMSQYEALMVETARE